MTVSITFQRLLLLLLLQLGACVRGVRASCCRPCPYYTIGRADGMCKQFFFLPSLSYSFCLDCSQKKYISRIPPSLGRHTGLIRISTVILWAAPCWPQDDLMVQCANSWPFLRLSSFIAVLISSFSFFLLLGSFYLPLIGKLAITNSHRWLIAFRASQIASCHCSETTRLSVINNRLVYQQKQGSDESFNLARQSRKQIGFRSKRHRL